MFAPRSTKRKGGAGSLPAADSAVALSAAVDPPTVSAQTPAIPAKPAEDGEPKPEVDGSAKDALTGYNAVAASAPLSDATGSHLVAKSAGTSTDSKSNDVAKSSSIIPERAQKLELLRHTLEECLSDWGLSCQNRTLLEKLAESETGYVHISHLLSLPSVLDVTDTLSDITEAIRTGPSQSIRLDETGFQVARSIEADYERLRAMTIDEWGLRTFYLENIPSASVPGVKRVKQYTLESLRRFLTELLDCSIDVLRLPRIYVPPAALKTASESTESTAAASHIGGLYSNAYGTERKSEKSSTRSGAKSDAADADLRRRQKAYVLPKNGGPFKGFAFVVLNDAEKAQTAAIKWSADRFDSGQGSSLNDDDNVSTSSEDDDGEVSAALATVSSGITEDMPSASATEGGASVTTPHKRALQSGFTMMPITTFNTLKSEYMAYFRDLTTLQHQREERLARSYRQRSDSLESHRDTRKKAQSPSRWSRRDRSPSPSRIKSDSNGRWERKPLSPSPERPLRTYDSGKDGFPRGCVLFCKRIDPNVNGTTLKTLIQAILEQEEMATSSLHYVDHIRNVDSCYLRFADAASASFIASYFTGKRKFKHVDASSTNPDVAFGIAEIHAKYVEVEVLTGTPESIYWAKVPLKARQAYSQ